jgi:anionic cell wall polymer biosynthesis LytR-Cps2A-Psr (LCP) family protein
VHQQDLILTLAQKLKRFDSPQQLSKTISSVSDAFTLSNTITLPEALSLAWSLRDIDLDTIQRLEIPVYLTRSPTDQSILVAEMTPREVIEAHYGGALPTEES